jgi:hypothetical protein
MISMREALFINGAVALAAQVALGHRWLTTPEEPRRA